MQLSSEEWGKFYNLSMLSELVSSIEREELLWQTKEMMKLTSAGDKVLEIGSGTGATSIYLALKNRICTALDYALPCLVLTSRAASRLKCPVRTVFSDATKELPFQDNEFDFVFQAGLLEHFHKEQRINLLRNWGRVGKCMVSIIPNAASLAYRAGKAMMEQDGTWEYGLELPQFTLYDEFAEAGFKVTSEYTIGEKHALEFLPKEHPLRQVLSWWVSNNICGDNCGQGYLLVTVGVKR